MNIKKYLYKYNKVNPFVLLIIGFVVGLIVMYLYFQPKLTYQGKTAQEWQFEYNSDESLIDLLLPLLPPSFKNLPYTLRFDALIYKDCMSGKPNLNVQCPSLMPSPAATPIPIQQNTNSSRQTFFNECVSGNIYCTCLYDVLHRIDPGNEATDYVEEVQGNGNNAPMINAYAECNSRFK